MFSENQPVHDLLKWRKLTKLLVPEKLAVRIQVCLQAHRKPPGMVSALAAGVRSSTTEPETITPQPLGQHFSRLRGTEAAALIEFAVALPLLVVLIVGIFDFGAAFNLKQELNNAVREGARFAAAQPTNDLTASPPASVDAVRYLVDAYLKTAKINDCGLSTAAETPAGGLAWIYTANTGCSGNALTLTISRGVQVQAIVIGQPAVNMLATTVSITYPYQWHFNSVIQLLVPGASYGSIINITSDATSVNMD